MVLKLTGRQQGNRPPKPVPAWARPWLIPGFVVLLVVDLGAAPRLVAIGVMLLMLAVVAVILYRSNQGQDYIELRRTDPLYRGLDDYRQGRGYRGLDQDGPAR